MDSRGNFQTFPRFNDPCLIVAEVGQNHQGDMEMAKRLILESKMAGADFVKFQKTCIEEKFCSSVLNMPYDGPNSWGKTYGEHKKFLEFSQKQFVELQKYAESVGIIFFATAMDHNSVDVLSNMSVPILKIGSGDSNNLVLIKYAAMKKIPLIVSTGMIDKNNVQNIYKTIKQHHSNFALLHCVSSYPTPYEDCNLNVLKDYQSSFPEICIGYSGHELGISVSLAAVALGAKIIERHITLDKKQKGSDHSCSLLPAELKDMVVEIRTIEKALGIPVKRVVDSEKTCMLKLQKSIVAAHNMTKGHIISDEDMKIKVSSPKGMNPVMLGEVIGKMLNVDKMKDDAIFETDFII